MNLLLVILLLGNLLFFFPHGNSKVNEVGRLMIGCALLVICFRLGALHWPR